MKTSEKVDQIAIALSKAQAVMEGANRSSTNPFFHSKYAELSEVWDACRKPLTDNGLSFIQSIGSDQGYSFTAKTPTKDNPNKESLFIWLTVTSRLQHISEQYYEDSISMPVEADPQSLGKCTTYIRRYAQMALCGIAPTDDDGNEASGKIIPNPANVNHNVPIIKNPVPTASKESTTPPEGKQEVVEGQASTPVSASSDKPKEHWCSVHNVAFFKAGNMRNYAHKLGIDGKWCSEPVAQKEIF